MVVVVVPGLWDDTRNLLNNHSLLVRREMFPLLTNMHRIRQNLTNSPTELNWQILELFKVHHRKDNLFRILLTDPIDSDRNQTTQSERHNNIGSFRHLLVSAYISLAETMTQSDSLLFRAQSGIHSLNKS